MCRRHYLRWYNAGGKDEVQRALRSRIPDPVERFHSQVERTGTCWLWRAAVDDNGYGVLTWQGRTRRAHQVALLIEGVNLTRGDMVCHHCDVRACVNPDHLYVGTAQSNSDDMWDRGRGLTGPMIDPRRGESNSAHKLTNSSVRWIRRQSAAGQSARSMAAELGVSKTAVQFVLQGKTWTHVV